MTAFSRGLNDAPKIAALGSLLVLAVDGAKPSEAGSLGIAAIVAVAMLLGSLAGGRRVTATLATKVTKMNDLEGTAANVVTAALLAAAATNGLPVSTTQVSGGSIMGIGLAGSRDRVNPAVVQGIALTWLVTVPGAGLIALGAWALTTVILGR
jgi:phosphate/sulfate permease